MRAPRSSRSPVASSFARIRAFARLVRTSVWQGAVGFYRRDNLTYAASIAYYALLSLFPLFLLAFAVLGRAAADPAQRNAVIEFVLRYFPVDFEFITTQLDALQHSSVSFGVAGTLALLWGALGVFGAITKAVNYAWGVESQHSFWQHKLISFLMLMVAGLLLVVALLLVSASQIVSASWFAGALERFPGLMILRSLTVRSATTLLFIVVVGFIFYFVPNADMRFRDVWPGASLTGLLWKGGLSLFSWYIHDMTRFTRVNGSIAAAVVFLVWVYVQAVVLLYGVEFTAAYARLRKER